jgi:CRP-like cAMP-binding protein
MAPETHSELNCPGITSIRKKKLGNYVHNDRITQNHITLIAEGRFLMKNYLDPRAEKDSSGRPRLLGRDVYYKDKIFFVEGDEGHRAYYIEAGRVEVSVTEGGHKVVISELGPGEIFGEMALLEDGPRTATVTALEDTTVTIISEKDLKSKLTALTDKALVSLVFLLIERLKKSTKGQARHYSNLLDFQGRIVGLADRLEQDFKESERDCMRAELDPLLDALEKVLDKYGS